MKLYSNDWFWLVGYQQVGHWTICYILAYQNLTVQYQTSFGGCRSLKRLLSGYWQGYNERLFCITLIPAHLRHWACLLWGRFGVCWDRWEGTPLLSLHNLPKPPPNLPSLPTYLITFLATYLVTFLATHNSILMRTDVRFNLFYPVYWTWTLSNNNKAY
jgi:hypothetical protein